MPTKSKKVTYKEPAEYIPKAIRKKYGLGEFYKPADADKTKKTDKKTVKKK